jgi:hypothetical protein
MIEVKQRISSPKLENYISVIKDELKKKDFVKKIQPGSKIAITAGSRGIAHYPKILATLVKEVKQAGGEPFLITAMGSHGGATPKGQLQVLESLGITSETIGAPISSSMEVDEVGRLDNGARVYVDRTALKADGIIVVGRVKPHTDFKGPIESGLMKMLAIGLGKQKGAEMIHWHKIGGYRTLIPAAAKLIMKNAPILMGLAIVENAKHEIAIVKALNPEEIEREEMKLLKRAKQLLARLPFKEIHVLIIDEIGKNFSGVGMDTNVVGRFWIPGEGDPRTPKICRIVVLDLSEETHGNAMGIGLADLTTQKAVSKINYDSTFVNCLTTTFTDQAKIPIFLPNDRDAIATALRTCASIDSTQAKVVRIRNTQELERFWVSESLRNVIQSDSELANNLELLTEPREMRFDVIGTLAR